MFDKNGDIDVKAGTDGAQTRAALDAPLAQNVLDVLQVVIVRGRGLT
jgi:hypothetical protein